MRDLPEECTPEWVFERYEAVRARLPSARFAEKAERFDALGAVTERYDVFVFDSFGVLNVGETPIAGAGERVAALRAAGKQVLVLTNAATGPLAALPEKYARLGFDFAAHEIISSRELLGKALAGYGRSLTWGIAAPPESRVAELGVATVPLEPDAETLARCDGFILLSSKNWSADLQAHIEAAVRDRPRPVLVGNPDLAAPREVGLSYEPGTFAHALIDRTGATTEFFGKPFANAFDAVLERVGPNVGRHRIAMIGDTLHTDILGGAAAGFGTILVTGHGILKSLDLDACIARSGIVPDVILPHI